MWALVLEQAFSRSRRRGRGMVEASVGVRQHTGNVDGRSRIHAVSEATVLHLTAGVNRLALQSQYAEGAFVHTVESSPSAKRSTAW